jgi:hypothetical protein
VKKAWLYGENICPVGMHTKDKSKAASALIIRPPKTVDIQISIAYSICANSCFHWQLQVAEILREKLEETSICDDEVFHDHEDDHVVTEDSDRSTQNQNSNMNSPERSTNSLSGGSASNLQQRDWKGCAPDFIVIAQYLFKRYVHLHAHSLHSHHH